MTSLFSRTSIGKITRDPCILATFENSDQLSLFRVVDEFGTVVPFRSFNAGSTSSLSVVTMAPILSYR